MAQRGQDPILSNALFGIRGRAVYHDLSVYFQSEFGFFELIEYGNVQSYLVTD